MQLNGFEYGMILHIIEELEKLKKQGDLEFETYCKGRACKRCVLRDYDVCSTELYFDLKDKGVIK